MQSSTYISIQRKKHYSIYQSQYHFFNAAMVQRRYKAWSSTDRSSTQVHSFTVLRLQASCTASRWESGVELSQPWRIRDEATALQYELNWENLKASHNNIYVYISISMQVAALFFTEYAHNVSVWAAGIKSRRATMRKGGTQRLYGEFRRHYRPDSPISGGNGERIIAAINTLIKN